MDTNINKCSFGLGSWFFGGVFGLVVEELNRLGVVVETLEEVGQQDLVVRQHEDVLVVEVHPDLHPVERLRRFGRNKAEAVDVFAVVETLTQQIKHQVCVDFVFVLLSLVDRKDKPSSVLVVRVLPFGLDAGLEVLERVDAS
jgi:hypothetical protein